MKKTLFCMNDRTSTIDVIEKDNKILAKWTFEDDSKYHEIAPENIRIANYHHCHNEKPSKYIVFGGWAFWMEDAI